MEMNMTVLWLRIATEPFDYVFMEVRHIPG